VYIPRAVAVSQYAYFEEKNIRKTMEDGIIDILVHD